MRLTDAERKRAKHMAKLAAPFVNEDPEESDVQAVLLFGDEAGETLIQLGRERGRHVNSLGWRLARRYGWRTAAVA